MTHSGRVRIQSALASTLLMAALCAPVTGQEIFEETGGTGFELLGAVGLMTPLGNLTSDPATFGTTINVNVAYGLDAISWLSRNWGVGATGWYSPAQLQAVDLPQGVGAIDLGDADYLVGMLQGIYRFRGQGSRSPLEPYFAAGGGVRHLSVDERAEPEVETATDVAATVAGGIRLEGIMASMMIRLEVRDNLSMYESPTTGESRLQNDVIVSFGVGVRF